MLFSIVCHAENTQVASAVMDIRNHLIKDNDIKPFASDLANYLAKNKDMTLDIRESLRHAAITNEKYRQKVLDLMVFSGLLPSSQLPDIKAQVEKYGELVQKLQQITQDINTQEAYTRFDCTGTEDYLYTPHAPALFNRNLRITDVSAHQDFLPFFNNQSIIIMHVPSFPAVKDYVTLHSQIKFTNIEEKLIYNNATAASMYNTVEGNGYVYAMFPQKIFADQTNDLKLLTAREYAYYLTNLALANRLNDEVYKTYVKIYKRNASLCLYSSN